jgi:7-carboxy-7-deazaguanine synthase
MIVSEIFGPTFQGEGPYAGRRAMFLRLGACNLACSWCDTPYTWDVSRFDLRDELRFVDVADVARIVGSENLVITGGEPLLQARAIQRLLDLLPNACCVEIETNGTCPWPGWLDVHFNISPKLENSGNVGRDRSLHPSWARANRVAYKFVVSDPDDLCEVVEFGLAPASVWIMPEGTTAESILETARVLTPGVLARGWNMTLRQHVLLHGNVRGV